MEAMGVPARTIDGAIRISFGRENTPADVEALRDGLLYAVGNIANLASTLGIILVFFRAFSRNIPARMAENERFMKKERRAANKKEYKYLSCPHCKQEMRVPRGKGTIAVKCPNCGESTITRS